MRTLASSATFVHFAVLGLPLVGRLGVVSSLVNSVVSYALQLAAVLMCAFVVEKIAPRFKSSGDIVQAAKLVAYASTPVWIAGVFNISLVLAPLIIIAAIYAVYLYYVGLPHVLKTPSDQVIPFMVVSAIVIIVVNVIFSALVTGISFSR